MDRRVDFPMPKPPSSTALGEPEIGHSFGAFQGRLRLATAIDKNLRFDEITNLAEEAYSLKLHRLVRIVKPPQES